MGRKRRGSGGSRTQFRQQPVDRQEPLPAGSDLGELGTVHDEVDLVFGWHGATIRVNPELSELEMVEFMDQAASIDEDDPKAVTIVKRYLRTLVHPDDFDVFWRLARQHRETQQDLGLLSRKLIEAAAGRPTSRPSDSSAGPQNTAPKSRDGSSLRVVQQLEREGRADIALAVVRRHEEQAAV